MITIFDYGAGNLRSVQNTLDEIGAEYVLTNNAEGLRAAGKIILPGVGHYGQMLRALDALEVRGALLERIRAGVPFLGICLGLQALFESSSEAPEMQGLGLFPGHVERFAEDARVPHMGWNRIEPAGEPRLLRNLGDRPYLYFAHSYYVPRNTRTAASCEYGVPFTAALEADNVFGVQFHPEKSGAAGLRIMRNFVELQ
ncbi:MAG TPA: imidazole glycerol phosphate synthase subunit HisH [Solibacterales bacterium]|nr:imidazole glycerol phosphate synthase subunit HisH [Bryobacterales bacterium]